MSVFVPRDQLKRHYNLKQFWLQVDFEDLSSFDALLADQLQRNPSEYLPSVRKREKRENYWGLGGGGGEGLRKERSKLRW